MSKTYKYIIGALLILLGIIIYMESSKPTPVNWAPSYSHLDKIPLGTYVFYQSLKDKAPQLKNVNIPPFEFLNDTTIKGTYFFANSFLMFDESEFNKLLNWAEKGNTVFLAAHNFSPYVLDTLHLEEKSSIRFNDLVNHPQLNFVNPSLKADSAYVYEHNTELIYFSEIDTLQQNVLGISNLKNEKANIDEPLVNFIEAPIGKGKLFIHSTPEVFSNYFILLKNNHEYAEKALAYLNVNEKIYWDNYYKAGKTFQSSPLYILLGNKSLKWFYYTLIIGALLFVFFEGKRKQKSIAVIPPLKNQTYNYTQTIAGMYLDKKAHKAIAQKQIEHFLAEVWQRYKIPVNKLDNNFINQLAERTLIEKDTLNELVAEITKISQRKTITEKELNKLDQLLTQYKKHTHGK